MHVTAWVPRLGHVGMHLRRDPEARAGAVSTLRGARVSCAGWRRAPDVVRAHPDHVSSITLEEEYECYV
jgi:hypothetical protein